MKILHSNLALAGGTFIAILLVSYLFANLYRVPTTSIQTTQTDKAHPILSVAVVSPLFKPLSLDIPASGNVIAWQEAIIGNQVNGLQLNDVLVEVGDEVKQGQVIATFVTDTLQAELDQSTAGVVEAEALFAEAHADANRARTMQTTKTLSAQQVQKYLTAEKTASARLQLALATSKAKRVQLSQAIVRSPDSGVISARSATVGAVPANGEELFRLIRKNRLEWRAEIAFSDLNNLQAGQTAKIFLKNDEVIIGQIRAISPVIDLNTRNTTVFVDLPQTKKLKAGMFIQGAFEVRNTQALTLPYSSIFMRDGFSYVFCVNQDSRIDQIKVSLGRRSGDVIEILDGIDSDAIVVKSGGSFLGNGDLVRIVEDRSIVKSVTMYEVKR